MTKPQHSRMINAHRIIVIADPMCSRKPESLAAYIIAPAIFRPCVNTTVGEIDGIPATLAPIWVKLLTTAGNHLFPYNSSA